MDGIFDLGTQALPLVVSLIALVITYKTFVRQRTFDNENYLFKYKIEKYNEVLSCLAENVTFIKKEVTAYYDKKLFDEPDDDYFDEKKDMLSDKIEETELILLSKIVFVSEDVIDELEKYLDFVEEANFLNMDYSDEYEESDIDKCRRNDIDNVYKLENMIYDIADAMRNDSGVEPLIKKLDKRLGHRKEAQLNRAKQN